MSKRVPKEVYDTAAAMAEAVRSNKLAAYLSKGDVERSYYTVDKMTGIEYKVRPDCFKIINGRGLIVDFKSTADASTDAFIRSAINYGYDFQAAMYSEGYEKNYGREKIIDLVKYSREKRKLLRTGTEDIPVKELTLREVTAEHYDQAKSYIERIQATIPGITAKKSAAIRTQLRLM